MLEVLVFILDWLIFGFLQYGLKLARKTEEMKGIAAIGPLDRQEYRFNSAMSGPFGLIMEIVIAIKDKKFYGFKLK